MVRAIIPEANEWVQTVTGIAGSGATGDQWQGEHLHPGSVVELEPGTLCLFVYSTGGGQARREWRTLNVLNDQGQWSQIAAAPKSYCAALVEPARKLLALSPAERVYRACHEIYNRAWSRAYHLEKWIPRIEKALHALPQSFQQALDSRDPTLKLPSAIPNQKFVVYAQPGGEQAARTALEEALARAREEAEAAHYVMKDYAAYAESPDRDRKSEK